MRIGVGLSIPELATRGGRFSPASLFTAGTVGAWYDPSDYSTLFQDSAGTTPVTAVEQPVGLMLDKSQGLVLGPELITNGNFATDTDWTKEGQWAISGGVASISSASAIWVIYQNNASVKTNTLYLFEFDIVSLTVGSFNAYLGGNRIGGFTTTGRKRIYIQSAGINTFVGVAAGSAGTTGSIDNVSVRELPGNHASQSTSTSRPVLRARYNLLTYSEQFDNAAWTKGNSTVTANQTTAPDGTTTADLLYPSTSGTFRWIYQTLSAASAVYTRSVYAKAQNKSIFYIDATGAGSVIAYFNLSSGTVGTVPAGYTATITAVGSGWYRCTMTNTSAAVIAFAGVYGVADADGSTTVTANGTDGIYIWGAQIVTGSSAGTYQRIAAATDYATAGFLPYLYFVTDDSFGTNSIDFSATDKMSVCAGVTKLSDAPDGMLVELSAAIVSNAGSFYVTAPETTLRYAVSSRGSAAAATNQRADTSSTTYNAPSTVVLTGAMNISGDSNNLRLNGTSIATATGDQGTGNYGNYPLFIGRRNNATLPFNGNFYQLVVVGKTLSAAELASTEAYVATKTGVTL